MLEWNAGHGIGPTVARARAPPRASDASARSVSSPGSASGWWCWRRAPSGSSSRRRCRASPILLALLGVRRCAWSLARVRGCCGGSRRARSAIVSTVVDMAAVTVAVYVAAGCRRPLPLLRAGHPRHRAALRARRLGLVIGGHERHVPRRRACPEIGGPRQPRGAGGARRLPDRLRRRGGPLQPDRHRPRDGERAAPGAAGRGGARARADARARAAQPARPRLRGVARARRPRSRRSLSVRRRCSAARPSSSRSTTPSGASCPRLRPGPTASWSRRGVRFAERTSAAAGRGADRRRWRDRRRRARPPPTRSRPAIPTACARWASTGSWRCRSSPAGVCTACSPPPDARPPARGADRRAWPRRSPSAPDRRSRTRSCGPTSRSAWRASRRRQRIKDDFLSIVSHELRTPLTSIQGYSQLLEARLSSDHDGESKEMAHLRVIRSQVGRMRRLVDDLLDVSRIDRRGAVSIETIDFDLADEVREAVGRIAPRAPRPARSRSTLRTAWPSTPIATGSTRSSATCSRTR